ncbi:hypothetical protein FGO68_gene17557 [Halteria grandinella]|uniref:Sfi1 spindle body domain-containing protein n=1 Tax=Halteria grandinella TaxID=5974 RepID=A0A8J8T9L2_HALGN|nr:hypothetical protein FGO68_gene17557 [Halteria grandinella]
MSAIVERVDKNHSMFRMRYILIQWRDFVAERKCHVRSLITAVEKTLWQNAFTSIRLFAKNETRNNLIEKRIAKLFSFYSNFQTQAAFSNWKTQLLQKVMRQVQNTNGEIMRIEKEQTKLLKHVYSRQEEQLVQHKKWTFRHDCFTAWKNEISISKALRIKTEYQREWNQERQKKLAVQKWLSRMRKTKKYAQNIEKAQVSYSRKLVGGVLRAWKQYNNGQRQFCVSLTNLANKVDLVYLKRAFQMIREQQDSQNNRVLFNKFKSCQFLSNTVQTTYSIRLKQSFSQVRSSLQEGRRQKLAARAISKYWLTRKLKETIQSWKEGAQLKSTQLFNNQEGVVAVETFELRKELLALKTLCLQEGISRDKIERILLSVQERNLGLCMRTISRLLCNGNPEIKVMPHCFDRWRQWVKLRKTYAYWLRYTSNFSNHRKLTMAKAFTQWKSQAPILKGQLKTIRKTDLDYISVLNDEKMGDLAQRFETSGVAVDQLTIERDFLLQKYLGAQKLAFSSVKAQNDRAKSKTLSKWLSQNQRAEKSQLEDALRQNLMKISQLKDRVLLMEARNQHVADQNEDLRQGALDGIEMAKNVDELTREREILTIDIADKAVTIRRLLEDNSILSDQLVRAQDAAHQLIHLTQRRLQPRNL